MGEAPSPNTRVVPALNVLNKGDIVYIDLDKFSVGGGN